MKYTFLNQELKFKPSETYKTYIAYINDEVYVSYHDNFDIGLSHCVAFSLKGFGFQYMCFSDISIQDALDKLEEKVLKRLKEDLILLENIYKDLLEMKKND